MAERWMSVERPRRWQPTRGAGYGLALLACVSFGCGRDNPTSAPATTATAPTAAVTPAPAVEAATAPPSAQLPTAASVAADETAPSNSPAVHSPPEPLDEGRIRLQPRKKAMSLAADLDGDGDAEQLTVEDIPAAADWRGGAQGAAALVVKIERGKGVLLQRRIAGVVTGWMRMTARRGGGREAALLVYALPEDATPRVLVATMDQGLATLAPYAQLPIAHWDWRGDGVDAIYSVSDELYQDYLKTGTTRLVAFDQNQPRDLLPFAAFEVCVPFPEQASGAAPLRLVAAERRRPRLHLLEVGKNGNYRSVGQIAVGRVDDGSRWSITSGFALHCQGDGAIQFRAEHYRVKGNKLVVAKAPPAAAPTH
jgi:hypothetical protein